MFISTGGKELQWKENQTREDRLARQPSYVLLIPHLTCVSVSSLALEGLQDYFQDFPGGPVVETLPCKAGTRVPFLVGELRSHIHRATKPKHQNYWACTQYSAHCKEISYMIQDPKHSNKYVFKRLLPVFTLILQAYDQFWERLLRVPGCLGFFQNEVRSHPGQISDG